MITLSKNERGDDLEQCSDGVTLNLSYWECECDEHYIHHRSKVKCNRCHAEYSDQPNAREEDVKAMLG